MPSLATVSRHLRRAACGALALGLCLVVLRGWAQESADERFEPIEAIRASAESFVRSQLAQSQGAARVSAAPLDERLRLARCTAPLHAQLPSGFTLQARATIGVGCDAPRWMLYVPVSIERQSHVLVLKHAVDRDAFLSAADVSVETRTTSGLGTAYLADPAELSGRAVRRTLAGGTVLTVDMLTPNYLVRRGQDVILLAGIGGIEVRAFGRALDDAPRGVRVKVQNLSSMKVVEGVAQSSGVVRVDP